MTQRYREPWSPVWGQAAGGHGFKRDRGDLWEAGGQIFRYADLVALAKG